MALIAQRCGWRSSSQFAKALAAGRGITPRALRRAWSRGPGTPSHAGA